MAPLHLMKFVRNQFTSLPEVTPVNLAGANVIVTGSNVGLGKEAARHLARNRPNLLVLAVRNVEKGQAAADEIIQSTGFANVQVWPLDQEDFASVKAFISRASKLDRLDIALLNAGIARREWVVTKDGYESTIQINDLTTTWLALGLAPLLKATTELAAANGFKPHLTITSSEVHFWAKFQGHDSEKPFAYLNDPSKFDPGDRYNTSKLINVFMAREVAKVAGPSVVVNNVNPGLCHSSLTREVTGPAAIAFAIFKFILARSTEVGSRNLVWAATQDTPPGAYVSDCGVSEESDFALSEAGLETQRKVWGEMMDVIHQQDPQISLKA